ncbi:MAG TPA: hypothetical protein VGG41_06545 [Solirubrobacteraceae bacterium]
MADVRKVRWLDDPEEKDYAAARSYLSLLIAPADLDGVIERLRAAPSGMWRAKDILRAARLPLLDAKRSAEVTEKLAKVAAKEAISPILVVVLAAEARAQIADGYHRTCAAYITHEDAMVPGRILFV